MTTVSQAEFARMEGKARSYITALKNAGRLVMAGDKVDVEASRDLIKKTADPNRDDVAQRFAEQRHTPAVDVPQQDKIGSSYQAARAVKEKFSAMQAKYDYEKAIGKIIEMEDAQLAQLDAMSVFRQSCEQFPHRISAELYGKDVDTIRATLKFEMHEILTELSRSFEKWKSKYLASL